MQVTLSFQDPLTLEVPLLVLPIGRNDEALSGAAADADRLLGGAFSRARTAGDFRGSPGEALLFYAPEANPRGPGRFLFIGVGARGEIDAEGVRQFAGHAVRGAEARSLTKLALHIPLDFPTRPDSSVQAAAEGGILAAWDYREWRSVAGEEDPVSEDPRHPLVESMVLCIAAEEKSSGRSLEVGRAFAEGENLARLFQSRPGNIATPTHLAEAAMGLAREFGFVSRVLGPKELGAEKMNALLAVSAGSDEEPRLIVLEHRGGKSGEPPLALVGKGVTFDSGGISIKPGAGMEEMKFDMSGAAAVLGAMHAVGTLRIPLNIVAVIPSVENLLSGRATRPGDIVRARNGKTIEIINTDAEGRLILADALSYVIDHFAPKVVVDCATLTGACVIALGNHASALLGNDEGVIAELREAGARSGERCWPLPLWKDYRKQLESTFADLKNVGGRPAGTITAALFLQEFIGDTPWAHLDIAGTAYGDPRASYQRKGGFGNPTRLLLEWLRARAG